jgi:hypothetical protein
VLAGNVGVRASAWIKVLDRFVSSLLVELTCFCPQSSSDSGTSTVAAQILLNAHADLDAVGQLCEPDSLARRSSEDSAQGERLIRAAEDTYVMQLMTGVRETAPRPLMPVSRVPYMKHFANRFCL